MTTHRGYLVVRADVYETLRKLWGQRYVDEISDPRLIRPVEHGTQGLDAWLSRNEQNTRSDDADARTVDHRDRRNDGPRKTSSAYRNRAAYMRADADGISGLLTAGPGRVASQGIELTGPRPSPRSYPPISRSESMGVGLPLNPTETTHGID